MLFNSYVFLFGFLPIALLGFFLLGRASRRWALRWIIAASLFFYGWWRPLNLLIITPSILVNYLLARAIERFSRQEKSGAAQAVLLLGIAFNVAFLGYFKYANFLTDTVNDVAGTKLILARIILPLGISFITFQKVAFLIDVHARRVDTFTLEDYCLFVLFFPQLIAGPIVHYREMMPQFHLAKCRPDREDLAVGLTLFMTGLFKKVVLADGIAPMIGVLYDQAASGVSVSLIPAWIAAIGFTLQIYFDFAGYTEMALGLARFFGVRFPPNFDSPLKASSIIDFWLRWHMTLTRFLTAYIYNPLVLGLTRRRAARGRPVFGGRNTTPGAFVVLLMIPTMITMLVSGVWHGAGYLFILWGLVHGVLLSINHAWRLVAARHWRDRASYERIMKPVGFGLTFVSVASAMILFRSSTVGSAKLLLNGMLGLNGVVLPESLHDRLGHLPAWVHRASVTETFGGYDSFTTMVWLLGLGVIALALPNTLQLLASYTPALGVSARRREWGLAGLVPSWRPTLAWGIGMSVIAAIGILRLAGRSEFLYWQF